MSRLSLIFLSIMLSILLIGCSHTLLKRERDESNPYDQGSETKFQLRGPRAAIQHKF